MRSTTSPERADTRATLGAIPAAPSDTMSGNTFGVLFCVTSFGESHGPAIGCVVDGCPPGLALAALKQPIDTRRWLLWSALGIATLVLGWMAWSLSRQMRVPPKP